MFATHGPFQLDGHARYSVSNFVLTCSWKNWLEVLAMVTLWLQGNLSLKRSADVCITYIYPLIFYCFSVLPLLFASLVYLVRALFWLLWGDKAFIVHHVVCYLHPYKCSLGKLDIETQQDILWLHFLVHMMARTSSGRKMLKKSFPIFKEHVLCWAEGSLIALKWGLLLQWIPSCTDGSFLHIDRSLWDLAVVLAFYHMLFRGQFVTIL